MKIHLTFISLIFLTLSLGAQEGGLDLSFNGNGKLLLKLNSTDNARAVILQPDNKIVLGGATTASSQDLLIVRLTANGSPDVTFGNQGSVALDIDGGSDAVFGMALQPDGKILAVGTAYKDGNPGMVLVRINTNGTVDKSFGDEGFVTMHLGSGNNYFNDVLVLDNGEIVTAGYAYISSFGNVTGLLLGFNADGSLNRNFGDTGAVYQIVNNGGTYFNRMKLMPEGKFLVCGQGYLNHTVFLAVKYNNDGTLDEDFAGNGITIASFDNPASAEAIAIQKDGKIILAGSAIVDSYSRFAAARFMPDGQLDQGFGTNGKVFTKILETTSFASSVSVLGDGKIMLAGNASGYWNVDYALVRYHSDGGLDHSFNYDGIMTKNIGGDDDIVTDAILQKDGRLVIVGFSRSISTNQYVLSAARFLAGPSTVGLEENGQPGMLIYPNPAQDLLHLKFEDVSLPLTLEVIDLRGVVVMREVLDKTYTALDISTLPHGIYSLRIMTEEGVLIKKVVVQ